METETETERKQFSVRPSPDAHERLSLAASWRGQSLSTFVLGAAMKEADQILATRDRIKLTRDDATMILDLLDNPSKPNEPMKAAFELHGQVVGDQDGKEV